MEMPEIVAATHDELYRWHANMLADNEDMVQIICLFGGDRLMAVRDGGAFFAKNGNEIVGVVSYSPTGEHNAPNIVGLWVRRAWRYPQSGLDIAAALMRHAIAALKPILRPGEQIIVDCLGKGGSAVCSGARLGEDYAFLKVNRFDVGW